MRRTFALVGVIGVLSAIGAIVLSVQPVVGSISSSPPAAPTDVEVTGSVHADLGEAIVPITCIQPDGGSCILDVQGRGGGALQVDEQGVVEVTGVEGARVGVEGPVSVTNPVEISGYSTVPTVALENGTQVSLTNATLTTLTATTGKGNCEYVAGDPTATVATTAVNIPSSPMSGRTAIEIFNHSNAPANFLICSPDGTATLTHGIRIESGDQSRKWEGLGAGVLVSCRCVIGTCTINYQEERCYQE